MATDAPGAAADDIDDAVAVSADGERGMDEEDIGGARPPAIAANATDAADPATPLIPPASPRLIPTPFAAPAGTAFVGNGAVAAVEGDDPINPVRKATSDRTSSN